MLNLWKRVYSNWKYSLSFVIIAVTFFVLNVVIKNFSAIISNYSLFGFLGILKFIWILSLGFKQTTTTGSFVTLIIISIFLGMLFTLITYKIKLVKTDKKLGFFGTTGIFLGFVAPGCASCGMGLLTLFGIGATTLYLLPLKGLEISLLAIAVLSFSTWKASKDILEGNSCKIPEIKPKKKRK